MVSSRATNTFSQSGDARVYLLDQAEVHVGMTERYRDSFLDDYRPAALRRGMKMEAIWLSPPVILNDGGNTLFVLWSYPNLEGFWRGRFADFETKGEWWDKTAYMVKRRSRTVLTSFMRDHDVHPTVAD